MLCWPVFDFSRFLLAEGGKGLFLSSDWFVNVLERDQFLAALISRVYFSLSVCLQHWFLYFSQSLKCCNLHWL